MKYDVIIQTIYNNSPQKVKQISSDAKRCLECWKSSYLEVRAKIEENERDARWEFDKKKLFGVTDYMAGICKDIHDVAQVLEEFYNIFGPELKVKICKLPVALNHFRYTKLNNLFSRNDFR